MAYHTFGEVFHEITGILSFFLCVLHNVLNWRWYLNLFKGKYSLFRIFHAVINFLLVAVMIGTTISSIAISQVFDFPIFVSTDLARKSHMVFSAWCFIMMAIHFGFHWKIFFGKMRRYIGSRIKKFILSIVLIYGTYQFFNRQIFHRMFGLINFTYFDYEEHIIVFFMDYLVVFMLIAYLSYSLVNSIKGG
ncbi:MAG: Membrane protein [Pseudothermotoga lettingae]|nr:MAG: Membrane protein [Pseudothermotoga lettingae]